MTFNPNKRITVEEALAHPYLEQYYDPTDEVGQPPAAGLAGRWMGGHPSVPVLSLPTSLPPSQWPRNLSPSTWSWMIYPRSG